MGFEAYLEYIQYHPKCQDFTDNSDDIEISSEKSRQIILNCYSYLDIDRPNRNGLDLMLNLNNFNITRNVRILVTIRVILKYFQRNHVKPF